jgi:hypothetical protein
MNILAMKSTIKTTNKTHAISVAAPAIPVNPSTAAMRPIMRNVIDQLSIIVPPFRTVPAQAFKTATAMPFTTEQKVLRNYCYLTLLNGDTTTAGPMLSKYW